MGLEKDYPSTVSAIARTCDKLTTKGVTSRKCLLCQRYSISRLRCGMHSFGTRPAQSGTQDWKQKISIRSYSDISPDDVPPDHVNLASGATHGQLPSHPDSIAWSLCYACHTTWTSRSIRGTISKQTDVPLPVWLNFPSGIGGEGRRVSRESMRSTIDDFLLDPDS
jgi:cytoplasmic tRNA 2-thiolation protein 2